MIVTYPLPVYVQRFFTERLLTQMQASPNTIASYRDTFRLLLKYATAETRLPPTELHLAHIDADIIARMNAAIAREAGTRGWQRSVRSSNTSRAVNPSCCIIARRCWRCRPNGTKNASWTS